MVRFVSICVGGEGEGMGGIIGTKIEWHSGRLEATYIALRINIGYFYAYASAWACSCGRSGWIAMGAMGL